MWIVNIALRRPYTFIVAALLIVLATPFALHRMAVDVLPEIDIPVINVVWSYNGLSAAEMSDRVTAQVERTFTVSVSDIERIESRSVSGLAIMKIFFQPGANIQTALAQVTAASQAATRSLPPGATPPLIIKYSASSLPVLQIGMSSPTLSDTELTDIAINNLRNRFVVLPGTAAPWPFGGKYRQVSVDLDGSALLAKGLAPMDVVNAISAQNLILPTGTAKVGGNEYNVALNAAPATLAQLGDIPVRTIGGATIYLKDVAQVRDGFQPQINIVRQDGERGVLMSVLKTGSASTLDVVDRVLAELPKAAKQLPEDLRLAPMFDQSLFVKAAIRNVAHEGLIAAGLTATLILLFLGSWRSTAIIAISIPLSVLSSILLLHALGQTINLMTLGGLALAVGILVDDATVTLENIERHLHLGKDPHRAIVDGAAEIAVPAFVSTLCICIVFLPMFFLTGVARHLFVPLAQAVVFAMLASYVISRTLVPTLVMLMMAAKKPRAPRPDGLFLRIHRRFERGFEVLRGHYAEVLATALRHRHRVGGAFLAFSLLSCSLYVALGRDFFPVVDAGQLRLHVRAPSGTRVEEMPRLVDEIEDIIRATIPAQDLVTIVDNIGGPYTPINTIYNNSGAIDTADAEIFISLTPGDHAPSADYQARLRSLLPQRLPGVEFFFQPADLVSQTVNFGLPAPIDIQFSGPKVKEHQALAATLIDDIRRIPGVVDAHIYQRANKPVLALDMDRTALQQQGLSARDVAQNLLVSLSSSSQTAPTYWLNPANGVSYNIAVQTRQHEIDSIEALMRTPVTSGVAGGAGGGAAASANAANTGGEARGGEAQLLGNLVQLRRTAQPAVVSRSNVTPAINIYANVHGRDLGSVQADIEKLLEATRSKLPRGSELTLRGQVQTMQTSFVGLGIGLVVAIVLVYLLIVVNFQSWLDPLIIVAALPAALAGIAWTLFLTGTTLNVPSLTGAIMTMGVATANSILLVSFARDRLQAGVPPVTAAFEAGVTRLRPVLMTALAMIAGMIPVALGLGEGAEQNAPLGRAVIGGMCFATVSTLIFVPLVFASLHRLGRTRSSVLAREAQPA